MTTKSARLQASSSSDHRLQVISLVGRALQGHENELLGVRDQDAQNVLDVLHHLMDTSSFSLFPDTHVHRVQHRLRRLLLKLALRCRRVPSQLVLPDTRWSSMKNRGGGAFADIYRGEYEGKLVAVKRLRIFQITDDSTKDALVNVHQSLYHESLLWRHLSHPHILPFLGIADGLFNESLCMVMPWAEHGNIRDTIRNCKGGRGVDYLFVWVSKWLEEIASGLVYLHGEEVNIAHGDLRGVNILIDSDWKVRLADFGLAVFVGESSKQYASLRGGASHWLAPELIDPESFGLSSSRPTFAADIYSFACVCIELYTSQTPFPGSNSTVVLLQVLRGERPPRPTFHQVKKMSRQMYALLQQCWDQSPDRRPTAAALLQSLSSLARRQPASAMLIPDFTVKAAQPSLVGDNTYWDTELSENPLGLANMHIRLDESEQLELQRPETSSLWEFSVVPPSPSPSPPMHRLTRDELHDYHDSPYEFLVELPSPPLDRQHRDELHEHLDSSDSSRNTAENQMHYYEEADQARPSRPRQPRNVHWLENTLLPPPNAIASSASMTRPINPVLSFTRDAPPQLANAYIESRVKGQEARTSHDGASLSQQLRPTFSPAIVRTPQHYRHPPVDSAPLSKGSLERTRLQSRGPIYGPPASSRPPT